MLLTLRFYKHIPWRFSLLVAVLTLGCISAFQQPLRAENVDSLEQMIQRPEHDTIRVMSLLKLGFHYEALDPDKALPYAREALMLAEELAYPRGIGWGYFRIGMAHFYGNRPKEGLDSLYLAKDYFQERGRQEHVATTLLKIALCLTELEMNEDAAAICFEAIQIREELMDSAGVAWAKLYLASRVFMPIREAEMMLEYGLQSLAYFERNNDLRGMIATYTTLSNAYDVMEDYEKSLEYHFKVKELYGKFHHHRLEAGVTFNIGRCYMKLGKTEEALQNLQEALALADSIHFLTCSVKCLNSLGQLYSEGGNPKKGINYLSTGLRIADSLSDFSAMENAHFRLSNAFKETGNFEKALDHYVSYASLRDSIHHSETEMDVRKLEALYQTEKKEAALKEKSHELQLLQKDKREQTILFVAGIACLLLVLVIVLLLLKQSRQRQRQEEAFHLAEMNKKERDREEMEQSMQYKNQQLVSYALQLTQKNEKIVTLQRSLGELKSTMDDEASRDKVDQLSRQIDLDQSLNSDWEVFKTYFEQVHVDFFKHLKANYPVLSGNDLRLCAFIKLNMTTKEIANVLGMPPKSVEIARYRLRKKLHLDKGENLMDFILNLG